LSDGARANRPGVAAEVKVFTCSLRQPIKGTRVATTSTTTSADLLVGGVASQGQSASVVWRYEFVRPHAQATTLQARRLGEVFSATGSQPAVLGGD
jgi:hypothetical protein